MRLNASVLTACQLYIHTRVSKTSSASFFCPWKMPILEQLPFHRRDRVQTLKKLDLSSLKHFSL